MTSISPWNSLPSIFCRATLQNTIAATFAIAKLTGENSTARTANQLRQCLSQVSAAGSPTCRLRCISCACCVEICPKDSLSLSTSHGFPSTTRDSETYRGVAKTETK